MNLQQQIKLEQEKLLARCLTSEDGWNIFARHVLGACLDMDQREILRSFQYGKRISVVSGTARGKDFISAVAALCFLYLTPTFNEKGDLSQNTKVALTAPTARQIGTIMMPEIARLHGKMVANGFGWLAGTLNAKDIKTQWSEWFLIGMKADEHNHEAWTGLHAANTCFIVTEASGIPQSVWDAIEGNLQGNSKLLIVFNNNNGIGFAAESQQSPRFKSFRLSCLNAPNVVQKKIIIPGQVDYPWVADKLQTWCSPVAESDITAEDADFEFEGNWYKPNDIFRVKVLGLAPKVAGDVLVPIEWIYLANQRWKEFNESGQKHNAKLLRLAADIAGMGRDSSCLCYRYDDYVDKLEKLHSNGTANHMQIAGKIKSILEAGTSKPAYDPYNGTHPYRKAAKSAKRQAIALIDSIGEGAGVYSRLIEQKVPHVHSAKFSQAAEFYSRPLKDFHNVYEFLNMRAYCYWSIRDWLNPANGSTAMLPEDPELATELSNTKWEFMSDGRVRIEKKEEIVKRLGRSPDKSDALALTFFKVMTPADYEEHQRIAGMLASHTPR